MRLILAGDTGLYGPTDYKYFIYNCNRNRCQHKYTVPIPDLSKLQFFVYFGAKKPVTVAFELVSTCSNGCSYYDVTNNSDEPVRFPFTTCNGIMVDGFIESGVTNHIYAQIGTVFATENVSVVNLGVSGDTIAQDYVIGQLPNGQWYGVFKNFTVPVDFDPTCFVVTAVFTFDDDSEIRYFSEEICIETCLSLMEIKACFPEKATTLGFDVNPTNKIYFGYHNGDPADLLGDEAVRYFHKFYVRLGYLINVSKKTTFKYNLSRNFRTEVEYLWELRCELVPEFYSDYLMATVARGEITVRETMLLAAKKWRLSDSAFELVDDDAKLWKPVCTLQEVMRQFFGCDECVNGEHACLGNPTAYLRSNINPAQWTFTFLDGTLGAGESIQYEVRRKDNQNLVATGYVNALPGSFSVPVVNMDLDEDCFIVRWRKICETDAGSFSFDFSDDFEVGGAAGAFSEWRQKYEGNCDEDVPADEVVCKTYEFAVFGSDDSQYTVKAILCDGIAYDSGPRYVGDGAHIPICAKEGTVEISGNIVISDSSADCDVNCFSYKVEWDPGEIAGDVNWTNCDGSPGHFSILPFGNEIIVCAREGTVTTEDLGDATITRLDPCVG